MLIAVLFSFRLKMSLENTPESESHPQSQDLLLQDGPIAGHVMEIQGEVAIIALENQQGVSFRRECKTAELESAGLSAGDIFIFHPAKEQKFERFESEPISEAALAAIAVKTRERFSDHAFKSDY